MSNNATEIFKNILLGAFPPPAFLSMSAVGIDISDSSLKFLEFKRSGGGLILGAFGERKIPAGVVVKGEVEDVDRLAKILHTLKRDYKFEFVRISLPEEKTYLFQTTIPNDARRNEIRSILEFKLEEYVPVPLPEAIFDYEIIGPHISHKETHVDVGVSVYAKSTIEAYRDACMRAKLVPVSFEIEAQASARSVIKEGDNGTYMIIDFGRARTGVAIVNSGVLRFTATLEVGGQALTDALTKHLGVSEDEAETIKNEQGFLTFRDNEQLFATLMKNITELRDELNRHLVFWNTHKDDAGETMPQVERIILYGGNANLAGLPEYLSTHLKIPVDRADTWNNAFSFEEYIPDIAYKQSFGYTTAIGLSLRSMG